MSKAELSIIDSVGSGAMAARDRRNETFESSIKEYSPYLFSLSYRLTGSFCDAQDLLQETLLKAWQYWGKLNNKDNPMPWLRKICVNRFIDNKRKSDTKIYENSVEYPDVFPDMTWGVIADTPTPEDELLADEAVRIVHSQCFTIIISDLSLYQRIVLVLNDIYKVGIPEISVLIDKSSSATKSLLHRAREKMVNRLSSYCSLVDPGNACKCKPWIELAHNLQKRREHLHHILSIHTQSKKQISETKKRIISLFNNLPLHPPPPLWIDTVIKKLK